VKNKKIIKTFLIILLLQTSLMGCFSADVYRQSLTENEALICDSGIVPSLSINESDAFPQPIAAEQRVSFKGVGDNIIYYGNVRDAASCALPGGRKYNFSPSYTSVAPMIQDADIAFINQETLMCGDGYALSYYPRFNGPQDLAYDLAEAGFDVVNIANNHMLDKGASGLSSTMNFWNGIEGITLIGGYKDMEDYSDVRIITVNDIRIAFLSYTFSTNGLTLPSSSSLIIPFPEENVVDKQIVYAKENADYIIVSVHWGEENTFVPNEEQKNFALFLSERGVDVILGHHPHVIQPIEWLERPDGGRTLCVYSLGNFMAEMAYDYHMLGGIISFDIVQNNTGVRTENVLFIPTVFYHTRTFYKNHVYLMSEFTSELEASHGLSYYNRTLSLKNLRKYLNNTISDEFLPDEFKKANR